VFLWGFGGENNMSLFDIFESGEALEKEHMAERGCKVGHARSHRGNICATPWVQWKEESGG
jgi:hypothetical protein